MTQFFLTVHRENESLVELKFNQSFEVKMTQFFLLSAPREKIDLNSSHTWRHMYTSLFNIYCDGLLNS